MSFVAELKRRNVFKVAVLYIVASWLILQVTDVSVSLLELPDWVGKTVYLFLALGFPFVLIFSWVYELTPEGLRREKDVDRSQSITPATGRKINVLIIAMLALAIGAVILDRLIPETTVPATLQPDPETADKPPGPTQLAAAMFAPDQSIAVLPFVNMSQDEANEYFSDGLSEELLNLLAQVPKLRVAARTSSFSFKGKDVKIAQVAEELNVAHVLEGSVRKSGDKVRITAQLIKASDGYHLWSNTYDRTLDDIFAVQDEIAASVVDSLKLTLLGEVPNARQTDAEAYSLYLQGVHLEKQGTPESYRRAISLLSQVLEIDPDYAPAWERMCAVYINQAGSGIVPRDDAIPKAKAAAEEAARLDPSFARAHGDLGWIAMIYEADFERAANHYRRARSLAPKDSAVLRGSAVLAALVGRLDRAIELQKQSINSDPVSSGSHSNLASYYTRQGRLDDAEAAIEKSLELNPDNTFAHWGLGYLRLLQGRPGDVLEIAEKIQSDQARTSVLALAYDALGETDAAEANLSKLEETYPEASSIAIAQVYALRGDVDTAFRWLDKAIEARSASYVKTGVFFDNLRADPRWEKMLTRVGLSDAQVEDIAL